MRPACRSPGQSGSRACRSSASIVPEMMRAGVDRNFMQGFLEDMPYDVPNYLVDYAMRDTHVPIGVLRGVNYSQNAFFKESFVDEMAHATARIPTSSGGGFCAASRSTWRCSTPPRRRRTGASRRRRACSAASRSTRPAAASARRWSRPRSATRGALRVHRVVSAIDLRPRGQSADRRAADPERDRLRA